MILHPRLMRLPALLFVLAAAVLLAAPAQAIDLNQAKREGIVGERPDGLLGVVRGGDEEVRRLVEQINARRLEEYRRIAERTDATLAAVQVIAGRRLIDEAPSGTYVLLPDGGWTQK